MSYPLCHRDHDGTISHGCAARKGCNHFARTHFNVVTRRRSTRIKRVNQARGGWKTSASERSLEVICPTWRIPQHATGCAEPAFGERPMTTFAQQLAVQCVHRSGAGAGASGEPLVESSAVALMADGVSAAINGRSHETQHSAILPSSATRTVSSQQRSATRGSSTEAASRNANGI